VTRKLAILALILLVAVSLGSAKEKAKKHSEESGGWGFFGPYAGMFNFDNLNTKLQSAPFYFKDKFGKNQLMLGGGGLALSEHVTVGGYGFGGHQTVHSESLRTLLQADYGGGMFELGWMPVTTPHFKLGPALGIGGAGFTLRTSAASNYPPDFDSLLRNGRGSWEITNSNFALAPAVNIMVPITWAGIYLKVGYLLTLFDKTWRMNSSELAGTPNLGSSGPFGAVQIVLGGSSGRGEFKAKAEFKPDEEKNKGDKDPDKESPEDQE
jgi:hypothetical protein